MTLYEHKHRPRSARGAVAGHECGPHCFCLRPRSRTTVMPRGQRNPLQQPTYRCRPRWHSVRFLERNRFAELAISCIQQGDMHALTYYGDTSNVIRKHHRIFYNFLIFHFFYHNQPTSVTTAWQLDMHEMSSQSFTYLYRRIWYTTYFL